MNYIAYSKISQNSLVRENTAQEAMQAVKKKFGLDPEFVEVLHFLDDETAARAWNTGAFGLPLYVARKRINRMQP